MPSLRLLRESSPLRTISYSQILSKSLDSLQTLPTTHTGSAKKPMPKGSTKRPLKPSSSDNQPRRNAVALAQRFLVTSFALALLTICLWKFSNIRPLSKWEQRLFNTLSILLTGIASLGLGSLSGHLGSMLRWPLLSRTVYQMKDVDLILGMSQPTGSLQLIKRHIRDRRISRTTFIVTTYLMANLIGRSSVAVFGLAYNMTDKTGIEDPILATNWTSALWTNQIYSKETAYPMKDKYGSAHGKDTSLSDPMLDLESDLRVSNATLKLGANTTTYSYELMDFKGGHPIPSNRTVYSTVSCSIIEVHEGLYWRWSNGNRTGPFDWGEESVAIVTETLLWGLNATKGTHRALWRNHTMSFPVMANGSHVSPRIYIKCPHSEFSWECWPTLTETVRANESHEIQPLKAIFHPTGLYRLLTLGLGASGGSGRLVYLKDSHLSAFMRPAPENRISQICSEFSGPRYQNKTIPAGYHFWIAGQAARLPILAIMNANFKLPRLARGPTPNQISGTAYVHTTLDVDWLRVVVVVASITGGQILAILAVLYYCNGVYTRDDSYLATAELLKTVINRFDGGKLMTGEELATSLDNVLGVSVSYGTRMGQDGGPPEVDLAYGLDANFPPFPQKKQASRNNC
ncbi:unnamed protein product [Tuber aestivum]|uniref:Uncharacterized protein n=1 Tax=Tuber aestivum TaxID=59557 RepID=A0A292Q775_9PEZI|nr:unnamed protein product [Tuber aestivum]